MSNGNIGYSHNAIGGLYLTGNIFEYSCNSGYYHSTERRGTCLASGVWDIPNPKCK